MWWKTAAPAEGAVAMPAPDAGIACTACHTVLPVDALTPLHITPHGGQPEYVHVCRNVRGCRLRAQDAGIYGQVA